MLDFLRIYKKNKELNNFYMSVFIRKLGVSLISIFIPVYLYQSGYQIYEILFYYLLSYLFFVLLSYYGAKIISKIGQKHAMLLSAPFAILSYVGLIFIKDYNILFFILPIFIAIDKILYFISYHLIFIKNSHKNKRGGEIAMLGMFAVAAGIISPYLGGVLANLNFSILFIISSIIILISTSPLFFTKDTFEPISFSFKKMISDTFKKENRINLISFSAYGVGRFVSYVIWPIFIINLAKNLEKTGLIVSVTTAISLLTYYSIGKIADKIDKIKLLRISSYIYAAILMLRVFVGSIYGLIFVDSLKKISQKTVTLPWEAHIYELAERGNYFEFILIKENIFNISRIIIILILIPIFVLNFYPFQISLIMAAIASLGYKYIHK